LLVGHGLARIGRREFRKNVAQRNGLRFRIPIGIGVVDGGGDDRGIEPVSFALGFSTLQQSFEFAGG
jgi:hypothetical protein